MRTGTKIGVLLGGLSSERELSLSTGEAVHAALLALGHDAVRIFVDRDLDLALRAERIEVAFLALHGRYGEDGCVQGLLELFGIPYTGSGVLSSALAMDKLKAKELFRLHNLPTPPYYVHRARPDGELGDPHGGFGFPCLVKPRSAGSSFGVCRVAERAEFDLAIEEAARFDEDVLVERFVEGIEVHVAILDGRTLGSVEIVSDRPIYDHAARRGGASLFLPPRLSRERLRGVHALAERAARALDCAGLLEVDLIVSPQDNEWLLEIDTQPALGTEGLVPKIARAAGLPMSALVDAMLGQARLHQATRAGTRTDPPFTRASGFVERLPTEPH